MSKVWETELIYGEESTKNIKKRKTEIESE